jgi:hypothetical protein
VLFTANRYLGGREAAANSRRGGDGISICTTEFV